MATSFQDLMRQVESLRAENTHLRRELQDNSSQLTQLENESHNMRDVLTHVTTAMQDEDVGSNSMASSDHENNDIFPQQVDPDKDQDDSGSTMGSRQGEELSKLSNSSCQSLEHTVDNSDSSAGNDSNEGPVERPADPSMLDQNSNSADESTPDQNWLQMQNQSGFGHTMPSQQRHQRHQQQHQAGGDRARSPTKTSSPTSESPLKKRSGGGNRELYTYLQELDQERSSVVSEIENEELHQRHYYQELEALQHKLESLPHKDKYSSGPAVDMSRRQLEYEMQLLHDLMQKELGSAEQIAARHDARLQRIRTIENEMLRMQQQYRHEVQLEKRDSGTCDLDTEQDGVVVIDACTNTSASGDAFPIPRDLHSHHDVDTNQQILHQDGPNGQKLVTIATQTPDAYLPPDVVASTNVDAEKRISNQNIAALYHGAWPLENAGSIGQLAAFATHDTASVMSFNSSNASSRNQRGGGSHANQQLGTKVEMVYSLLSMLGTHDKDDMSRTLLAMSSSQDSCIAMRQSGCLPLLIQLLHGSDSDNGLLGKTRGSKSARARAAAALHNIVHSHPDDKRGRREARVLRLLEQIRAHCDQLRLHTEEEDDDAQSARNADGKSDIDHHPGPAIAALMKWSFDEEHRHAICTLGGLQAIAELLQVDYDINGNTIEQYNITMRRYACMALTNLTFGDGTNKALLCSMRSAMRALVAQLRSPNEDLRQVAASVLRNLSWRADLASKKTLREVDSVTALMQAAMEVKKESTLKSILSALWNLSAHCSENKADVCAVDGALAFLVGTLMYKSPSQTLAIIENGGGILRNVSSHIAVREEYRKTLREYNCLQVLLKHLRSPSLTIVSNACGTLWNISARCPEDQKALWELGAVSMLKNLVHSKHKMISMGSAAALKNLLSARPHLGLENDSFSNPKKPGLHIRKQRALEAEIDQNLAETCDNMESPISSPPETRKHDPHRNKYIYSSENCGIYQVSDSADLRRSHIHRGSYAGYHRGSNSLDTSPLGESKHFSQGRSVSRSGSQDSVGSVHSDISHDRTRVMLDKSNKLLGHRSHSEHGERQRDTSRHSSADRHHSADRHSESTSDRSNSRIVKVMQEVVKHVETDGESHNSDMNTSSHNRPSRSQSQENNRQIPSLFKKGVNNMHRSYDERDQRGSQGSDRLNNSMPVSTDPHTVQLTTLSNRMENLHLSMDDEHLTDDQPINFSAKYQETPSATPPKTSASKNNQPLPHSQSSAFDKPSPKVDNYVGGINYPQKNSQNVKRSFSAGSSSGLNSSGLNSSMQNQNMSQYHNRSYGGTTEEACIEDQPTNFSMRFAEEHEDDHSGEDQPINYSSRFDEQPPPAQTTERGDNCADCKLVQARRTNEFIEDQLDAQDTVRTFCTEGTPLVFMSTATSMTDLSSAKSGQDEAAPQQPQQQQQPAQNGHLPQSTGDSPKDELKNFAVKCLETETSITDSHSTERNTGSTVIQRKQQMDISNIQNNNVANTGKGSPDDKSLSGNSAPSQPSLCSYNDSSSCTSPSEKPKQYCTEGTPMSFSRVSSLSSLHSSQAGDDSPGRQQDGSNLKCIDENDSLNLSSQNVTLKEDQNETIQERPQVDTPVRNPQSAGGTPGGKSVTFDENNQVQETPLMFSRCSSLGSLSSFDAHSVHSSVMSDYSRRTSGAVSPSDLPDSPSDTMPPTPSQRKSPTHGIDQQGPEPRAPPPRFQNLYTPNQQPTIPEEEPFTSDQHMRTPKHHGGKVFCLPDDSKNYATEGSPGDFSCATSLSALTIDDEPKIKKETNLMRVPLGEDDGMSARFSDLNKSSTATSSSKSPDKEQDLTSQTIRELCLDESEDNSEVSEGEEHLLAEFINIGMPTASSKVKKTKKPLPVASKASRLPAPQTPNKSLNSTYTSTLVNTPKQKAQQTPQRSTGNVAMGPSAIAHLDLYDQDTPTKFATEGTPLNFSTATSLSDLSVDDGSPSKSPKKESLPEDDRSDVSSLASEDNEDLLSEAIEAAMPNYTSKKPKTQANTSASVDRQAEGSEMPVKRQQQQRVQYQQFKKPQMPPQRSVPPQTHHIDMQKEEDTVKTYAVEGTPINFSRATSPLSELRINDDYQEIVQDDSHESHDESHDDDPFKNNMYLQQPPSYPDSPKVYGMEGTPISYSRNDSLSDLSCDDDVELNRQELKVGTKASIPNGQLNVKGMPVGAKVSPRGKGMSPRKAGIQSPAIARLKTPSKSFKHEPSMHSTPVAKHHHMSGLQTPPTHLDDMPKVYAVEGTPDCFSRNSSLSSLDSDEHEALANNSGGSDPMMNCVPQEKQVKDGSKVYLVEDTPANLSGSSPLSSLSVESLSFEPTLEESALLEECINAAMPKSTKTSKPRTSPSSHRQPPRASGRSHAESDSKSEQSKNVHRPQAETVVNEGRTIPETTLDSGSSKVTTEHEFQQISYQETATRDSNSIYKENASKVCKKSQVIPDHENRLVSHKKDNESESTSQSANIFDLDEENMQDIEIDANKLAETFQELENKFAELGMTKTETHEKDLCLEAEQKQVQFNVDETDVKDEKEERKVKPIPMTESMTKSAKALARLSAEAEMQSTESIDMGCKPLQSDNEDGDILKESFPDLSSSLVSNLTTPDLDKLPSLQSSSDNVLSGSIHGPSPLATSSSDSDNRVRSPMQENTTLENQERAENVTVVVEQDNLDDTTLDMIEDNITYEEGGSIDDANISAEDQKALEENANLILCELSATQDISNELLDPQLLEDNDDLLIEHETISLVSNDYTSDTASEVSVALSEDQSEALSEQASEVSSSTTLSHHSTVLPAPEPQAVRGPRISKPGTKEANERGRQQQQDEPKGIRGKKKVYRSPYAAGANSVSTPKKEPVGTKPIRPGQQPIKRPNVKPPSPPERKTPVKQTLAKSSSVNRKSPPNPPTRSTPVKQSPVRPSTKTTPPTKPSSPGSPKPTRKYGINVTPPKSTGKQVTSKINTGIPKVSSQKSTPERPKLQSEQTVIERRPAPPIKQGTFTKDEPVNEDAPTIDSRTSAASTDLNGNQKGAGRRTSQPRKSLNDTSSPSRSEIPTPSPSRLPQQRKSRTSPASRLSGNSQTSTSTRQDSQDSDVKETKLKKPTSAVTGIRKPSVSSPARGTGSPSAKATAAVTGVSRKQSPGNANQMNTGPNAEGTKTGSVRSLNKSNNSNSTITRGRAASQDSLSRVTETGRPSPARSSTPPRAPKRNDSQSSLNNGSRSNTPIRKNSVTGSSGSLSTSKKTVVPPTSTTKTTAKKPAVSKIASLWRKDSKKTSEEENPKTKPKKSTLSKKSKEEGSMSKKVEISAPIKRSSTYDKLDDSNLTLPSTSTYEVESKEVRTSVSDVDQISSAEVAQRTMWRRTYTIKNDDEVQSFEIIGDAPSHHGSTSSIQIEEAVFEVNAPSSDTPAKIPKSKGLKKPSMWRRDTDKTKVKEPKVKSEKGEKKKGFSLFKRDSDSSKDKSKNPGPGYVKNVDGVWVKMDGTIIEDGDSASSTKTAPATADSQKTALDNTVSVSAEVHPVPPPTTTLSPISSPTKNQPAAIVTPFNYKPLGQVTSGEDSEQENQEPGHPAKPLTKTEMLLARRRAKKQGASGSEASLNDDENKKTSCLVTTV